MEVFSIIKILLELLSLDIRNRIHFITEKGKLQQTGNAQHNLPISVTHEQEEEMSN